MDWKDVEVGDYVSIKYKGVNQIFSGEITQIRPYNRQTDTMYEFRIKIQRNYGFKEYALSSLIWNLINIQKERKDNMFKVGDKVKVEKSKHSESTPGNVQEFTGKIVHIASGGFLRYLICSEELQEKREGHDGKTGTEDYDNPGYDFAHWWVHEKSMTLIEEQPEPDPIDLDLFKYDSK